MVDREASTQYTKSRCALTHNMWWDTLPPSIKLSHFGVDINSLLYPADSSELELAWDSSQGWEISEGST